MSSKDKIKKKQNKFFNAIMHKSSVNSLTKILSKDDDFDENNRSIGEALCEIDGNNTINEENITYESSTTHNREDDREITREKYLEITDVVNKIGKDDFEKVFAIDNAPTAEIEEKIVDEVKKEVISGYIIQKPQEEVEQEEEEKHFVIDGISIIKKEVITGIQTSQTITNENTPHLREYNNKPKFYKPTFGKAKTGENNLKKYLFMACASVIVGIIGGVEANSYYLAVGGDVPNTLACSWSWLPMFDTLTPNIFPFYANVFFLSFIIWASALGLVFLFSSMSNAEKKASRVGHEHGSMRLATKSDFKKYINKFMD